MAARDGAPLADAAFAATIALHDRVRRNLGPALMAAHAINEALAARRKLLVFALTADTAILTSIANDYSYKHVFARQIEALGQAGDIALGISTSGESPNVFTALQVARERGLRTIALTGRDGGSVGAAAEIHVNVPDQNTARVQEVHRTLLHVMCELIDASSQ